MSFYTNSQKRMVLTKEGNFNVFGGFTLTDFAGSLYGGIVGYKPDGRFFDIIFTGNSNDVLLGDGTFSNTLFSKYWKL
ncbi:MAG: hypothetical protein ABIJ97_12460, partial [Bacteroidota bacterium]